MPSSLTHSSWLHGLMSCTFDDEDLVNGSRVKTAITIDEEQIHVAARPGQACRSRPRKCTKLRKQ